MSTPHAGDAARRLSAALNEINDILMSDLTWAGVLARLVDQVSAAAGADKCLVVEVHDGALTISHVRNMRDDLVGEPKDASFYPGFALAAQTRKPLLIDDCWNDPRTNKDFVVPFDLRAFQLIPLMVEDEVIGVLAFAYDAPQAFGPDDREFAERMTGAMSLTLKNARLYETQRVLAQSSSILADASAALSAATDIDDVLPRVLEMAGGLLGSHGAQMIVRESGGWRVRHRYGFGAAETGEFFSDDEAPGAMRVLRTREPILIADVVRTEDVNREVAQRLGYRSAYAYPLVVRDEVVGVLSFLFEEPREGFADAELNFASRLAYIVSIAEENARLFEGQQAELAATALLREIAAIAASTLDLTELAERSLETARRLLGATTGNLFLLDEEAQVLRSVASFGIPEEAQQIYREVRLEVDTASTRVALSGERLTHDAAEVPDSTERIAKVTGAADSGWVIVPVGAGGRILGTLGLSFAQRRPFAEAEISLFQALADQLGSGIERAELFAVERSMHAAEEERRSYAEALNRINAVVHSTFDLDELLHRVTVDAGQALNFGAAAIIVRRNGSWTLRNWFGIDVDVADARIHDDDAPVLARIAETHEMVVIDDAWEDPRASQDTSLRFGVRGIILAPLMARGSAEAFLFLGLGPERDGFTEAQVDFGRKVASTISLGIENSRLYQLERERLARMETLHELTDLAVSSLDTEEVAHRAFAYMTERLDVTYVNGFAYDPRTGRLEFLAGVGGTPAYYEQVTPGFDLDSPFEVARVFTSGEPVVRETIPADGPARLVADLYDRSGMPLAAYAVLPLLSRTGAIGVLALAWAEERRLGEADIEFYTSLANELATALSNARLYESEHETLARTTLLKEIAAAAASSIDETELAARVIDSVSRLTGAASGAIFKVDEEARVVRSIAAFGPEGLAQRLRETPLDEDYFMARTVLRGEILTHENDAPSETGLQRVQGTGILDMARISVPIRIGGVVQGGFALVFAEQRHFSEDDLGLFLGIADQLGTAMEKAELFQAEKDARSRAEASEDKARSLIEFAPTAIYEIDLLGRTFVSVNEVVSEWTGYARDELLSMDPFDLLDETGRKRVEERIQRKIAGEPGQDSTELRLLMKDGEERDIVLNLGRFTYQGGQPVSVFVVAHDITERKAAEEAVRRQAAIEEGINRILHAALTARSDEELGAECLDVSVEVTGSKFGFINEIGDDGLLHDISMSNPGWEACETQDKTGHRLTPGAFELHGLYGRVVLEEKSVCTNSPGTHPDSVGTPEGHPALTAFLGVPLMSEGRPIGLIAVANREGGYTQEHVRALEALARVVVEAFQRMRAEQKLAATTQRLDAHINNSPLAVIEFDSEYRVIRWSEEAQRMFGWAPEEILGKAIGEMRWVYEEDASLVETESQNLASSARPRSVNVNRNYRKNGTVIWCEWYDSAIYDADGNMVSILSLVLDITERRHAQSELEAERTRLREIIEDIPVGVALVDRDGSVLEINEATDQIWAGDLPKADSIEGYRMYVGYHRDTGAPMQPHEWPAARSIETGERVAEIIDITRLDQTPATIRVDAIPIKDEAGDIARLVVITEDVTERLQAERLKGAITAISVSANSTFDVDEILHRILVAASEALHSEASSVVMRTGDQWTVREVTGAELAAVGDSFAAEQFAVDPSIVEEGRPLVVQDVREDHPLNEETLTGLGIRSLLVAPIVSRGEVIGVMAFHHQTHTIPFTSPEIDFAAELMSVATLALDNAALYERERRIADTLQEAMLAPPEPLPELEIAYLYRPASAAANVGGDFYDVFGIDADEVGILIGDVSGKGLEAARHTSLIRSGARAYAFEDPEPTSVLKNLNTLVHRSTPLETFGTVFFGVLDRHSGILRYCGGGHPAGLIRRSDGVEVLRSRPPIVGVFPEAEFWADETILARGDLLVLYTDGLVEARGGGELFAEQRAVDAVERLRSTPFDEMPQRLLDEVLAFSGGELRDDIVILCVRRTASASS